MSRTPLTWDRLPLFATDDEIGEAVLGRDRRREFAGIAQLLERDGMPKMCPVWAVDMSRASRGSLTSNMAFRLQSHSPRTE